MRNVLFRVIFRSEAEGGLTAMVPSLPGCISYGEDMAEARKMAHDAVKAYLQSMKKHGEGFCDDSERVEGLLTVHYE